jgi:hypothetical protein
MDTNTNDFRTPFRVVQTEVGIFSYRIEGIPPSQPGEDGDYSYLLYKEREDGKKGLPLCSEKGFKQVVIANQAACAEIGRRVKASASGDIPQKKVADRTATRRTSTKKPRSKKSVEAANT